VTPDEEGSENGFGEEVKNTIEHGLGIGGDHVAT
jgi:hypothetical protein